MAAAKVNRGQEYASGLSCLRLEIDLGIGELRQQIVGLFFFTERGIEQRNRL